MMAFFNVLFGGWEKIPRIQATTLVHLFVSVPPYHSFSQVNGRIKSKTSWKFLTEKCQLEKKFWGGHLWARGYFVASLGISNK